MTAAAARRQARKAAADARAGLPQTRDIDAALANAFAAVVKESYGGKLDPLRGGPLAQVVAGVVARLHADGCDVQHPLFKQRVYRRLGGSMRPAAPRSHDD